MTMFNAIDHIGIACRDLDERIAFYATTFGLSVASVEVGEAQGVREAMIPLGEGYLQLLEPLRPDSPVGRFLSRRGEGVHHIGISVPDLDAALAATELDPVAAPGPGSRGSTIAFLHPTLMGGVLTELVQRPAGPGAR